MQNQNENMSNEDAGMIARFKAKASEFMTALSRLNSMDNIPPNLEGEYSTLKTTAEYIQGTISTITTTVDSVSGFFSDYFGLDGVTATRNYMDNRPNELGFLPLVPLAAITGALAIMSKFISDVYLFERKVSEQQRLESKGMPPAEAAKIIGKMTDQGLIKQVGNIAKPLGFALGAFFLLKVVKGFTK